MFIGGKFIGGGDETAALDKKNQLRPMLEQVGALAKDNQQIFRRSLLTIKTFLRPKGK